MLCLVYTIVYLKPTTLLGYTALQMFCSYSLWYMDAVSHANCFVLPHQHFLKCVCVCVCAVPSFFFQFLDFMLTRYVAQVFSEWFGDGPVVSLITRITFAFAFHMRWISIVRSLYFGMFSASFVTTFLPPPPPEIPASLIIYLLFSSSRIMMSDLLLGMILSVCTFWFHNMVTPSRLVSTNFGTWPYQCSIIIIIIIIIMFRRTII